jgi:serine/threonine-protein kinase
MASSETALKLRQDIEYAHQHNIQGTPLVVVNGREAPAFVPFLYALIMAGGDASAPAFAALPPPRPPSPGGHGHGHEGHAHPHPH